MLGVSSPDTWRQTEACLLYAKEMRDEPSLTDRYLMQLTKQVYGLNWILADPKDRPDPPLEDFKLVRKSESRSAASPQEHGGETPEEEKARLKKEGDLMAAVWAARLGMSMPGRGKPPRPSPGKGQRPAFPRPPGAKKPPRRKG